MGSLSGINVIFMLIGPMLSACISISCFIVCSNFRIFATLNILYEYQPNLKCVCIFSADIEVTVEFLIELDKLVQLIESPIFACNILVYIGLNYQIRLK